VGQGRLAGPRGALRFEQRVAERGAEAVADGGAEQKALDRRGLEGEYLLEQEVLHVAMAAGLERLQHRDAISAIAQGDRGQAQTDDPALRALVERGYRVVRRVDRQRAAEKGPHLIRPEAQRIRAN